MKKLGILFASVFLLGLVFQSCNNGKTYAEMKEEEREAIKRFIEREDINVISFEQFQEQDSTTNVDENQFCPFLGNRCLYADCGRGKRRAFERRSL
mgnify:CR=1 FL=1